MTLHSEKPMRDSESECEWPGSGYTMGCGMEAT